MKALAGNIKYSRLAAIIFALVILLGALLLSLPISSKNGIGMPFVDALFTSASASCVTGMVIYDTYSYFTLFGQLTILVLCQIGGIGFMVLATLFSMLLKRRIGLNERIYLQEASGSTKLGGVVRLTRRILMGTLIFEVTGTILLALSFCPKMGFGEGLYYAFFHSVSAFCNAGFDLMGRFGHFSSLTAFADEPYVLFVLAMLIIIGSIGFLVWDDIIVNKLRWSHYMLHTKVVLVSTGALILFGSLVLVLSELEGFMSGASIPQRIVSSVFHSISFRTAGFASAPVGSLSQAGVFLVLMLMLVGGSPGSTAGGIKTTTVFVMIAAAISSLRGHQDINAFKRRFEEGAFRKACAICVLYILISFAAIELILLIQDLPPMGVIFEVLSAIGTVGLSTGITGELALIPKLVIVCLMFFGRMGVLSMAYALVQERPPRALQYPQEKLIIG